jgi:hypothetical protein
VPIGYTPPAGNAVNLNFTGAYSAPLGSAVFINFTNPQVLTADAGTYVMTGSPASLKVGRLLRAYDNLILNGQFTLDTANWTVNGSDTTFVSASKQGELALGPAASGGFAWQAVSVVPGKRYNLSAFLKPSGYYLSADPGSYVMTGTDATLTPGGGGSTDIADYSLSESGSGAIGIGIEFKPDGDVYRSSNKTPFETVLQSWLPAFDSTTNYRMRATYVSGVHGSGTFGSWVSLNSIQEWGLTQSSIGTISTTVFLELQRSDGAGGYTLIDTATITITGTRTS